MPEENYPSKLPKEAEIGKEVTILVNNKRIGKRLVSFKRTPKEGFGKWKITKNIAYK